MRIRNPFRRRKRHQTVYKDERLEGLECRRRVNYDGTNIEISGVNLKGFTLGGLGVEKKVLQTATHALMILDFEAYDLCMAVRGAPDKETKTSYYKRMMDDKLLSSPIYKALAALTIDPESKELKVELVQSIATSRNRALEIERSKRIKKTSESE